MLFFNIVGFHKQSARIYDVIDRLCYAYDFPEREINSNEFIEFITNELGNNKERRGLNFIFKHMMDKNLVNKA